MVETIFTLLGIDKGTVNIDDNVLFCICSILLIYCLGYGFNFIQVFMERLTAKKR